MGVGLGVNVAVGVDVNSGDGVSDGVDVMTGNDVPQAVKIRAKQQNRNVAILVDMLFSRLSRLKFVKLNLRKRRGVCLTG